MDYNLLADLLFPNIDKSPDDYEKIYPERDLAEGAKVTRLGPSPTGFIHLGISRAEYFTSELRTPTISVLSMVLLRLSSTPYDSLE